MVPIDHALILSLEIRVGLIAHIRGVPIDALMMSRESWSSILDDGMALPNSILSTSIAHFWGMAFCCGSCRLFTDWTNVLHWSFGCDASTFVLDLYRRLQSKSVGYVLCNLGSIFICLTSFCTGLYRFSRRVLWTWREVSLGLDHIRRVIINRCEDLIRRNRLVGSE